MVLLIAVIVYVEIWGQKLRPGESHAWLASFSLRKQPNCALIFEAGKLVLKKKLAKLISIEIKSICCRGMMLWLHVLGQRGDTSQAPGLHLVCAEPLRCKNNYWHFLKP